MLPSHFEVKTKVMPLLRSANQKHKHETIKPVSNRVLI